MTEIAKSTPSLATPPAPHLHRKSFSIVICLALTLALTLIETQTQKQASRNHAASASYNLIRVRVKRTVGGSHTPTLTLTLPLALNPNVNPYSRKVTNGPELSYSGDNGTAEDVDVLFRDLEVVQMCYFGIRNRTRSMCPCVLYTPPPPFIHVLQKLQ